MSFSRHTLWIIIILMLILSAFYCTSGDRAKKRADDGFDMVCATTHFFQRGTIVTSNPFFYRLICSPTWDL